MKVTISNAFENDGLFTAIRDPMKLLEMQAEAAFNMREEEIFFPAVAENSDYDEELILADMSDVKCFIEIIMAWITHLL